MQGSQDVELKIIAQTYQLGRKIDQGAFGKIYKATKLSSSEQYAVKLEPMKAQFPQLLYECKLYLHLHSDPTAPQKGFPMVYECGVEGRYNYLVMELMGPSLESLLNQCGHIFTLKTTLMLLDQMLANIQYFHSRRYIHRDIKPDNYCVGVGKPMLYLLDFGLAKQYVSNGKHIAYKEGKSLTGTARYASVNTHLGVEQSRRDDMESIGYVAIYLARGLLPWQGQKGGNKQDKYEKIKLTKMNTSVEALCRTFPEEFKRYMISVRNLKFTEEPNYEIYRNMFRGLFCHLGFKMDYQYDWMLHKNKNKGKQHRENREKEHRDKEHRQPKDREHKQLKEHKEYKELKELKELKEFRETDNEQNLD